MSDTQLTKALSASPMGDRMRTVEISSFGGPEALQIAQRPVPVAGPRDVLIRVAAAGINRPDILQRQGLYPAPPDASDILGLEISGRVVGVGIGVQRWRFGDQVCALVPGGGYAEYACAHETNTLPIPTGLSFLEAAGLPETYFTVWNNVFLRGRLRAGEILLIHGGTSGIGTTAIQLAKAFGATVITTAGSDEKCAACLALGADVAINYRTQDFVQVVKNATNGYGADVILDMVGGDYIPRNHEAAAFDGRIIQIAFLKGAKAEVNFQRIMLKRLTQTGSTLRSRPIHEKAMLAHDLETHVWPLIERGFAKPVIYTSFPLEQVIDAHKLMESSLHVGKIILNIQST